MSYYCRQSTKAASTRRKHIICCTSRWFKAHDTAQGNTHGANYTKVQYSPASCSITANSKLWEASWNMMAHAQKTRFRLSAKRTSPFKSAGASVQSTAGSRGVRISGRNSGYTMFRKVWRVLAIHSIRQFPHPFPCVTLCHHISTGFYTSSHKGSGYDSTCVCVCVCVYIHTHTVGHYVIRCRLAQNSTRTDYSGTQLLRK